MKGVILAGGLGTRLRPLTNVTNKHLLPVYDRPMIFYPIETLVKAGVEEIIVVTGGPFAGDFLRVLKNGEEFGIKRLSYVYQEGEGGIAHALSLAENRVEGESIAVILGDNTTDADISKEVEGFKDGALIFLKEVLDPERFGVATLEGDKIVGIEEKPKEPKSKLAVTGLYLYDETVFEKIRKLKPSARNELEITDLNNFYLAEGRLRWAKLDGFWRDAGTFETLWEVGEHWRRVKGGGKER